MKKNYICLLGETENSIYNKQTKREQIYGSVFNCYLPLIIMKKRTAISDI